MADFCIIILNFSTNFVQKERKRNGAVPFCVPLNLEASVPKVLFKGLSVKKLIVIKLILYKGLSAKIEE